MANILIVDDDRDACEIATIALSKAGHHVHTAANGREALTAIIEHLPDLLVADLLMPEMDGPSLLEVVRSYLRFQSLPIVIWTGISDSPMIERAKHANVHTVLVKAKSTPDDLAEAVEQELHRPVN